MKIVTVANIQPLKTTALQFSAKYLYAKHKVILLFRAKNCFYTRLCTMHNTTLYAIFKSTVWYTILLGSTAKCHISFPYIRHSILHTVITPLQPEKQIMVL